MPHSQRLYALVDLSPPDDEVRRRLTEAEEQIYAASDELSVNWEATALGRWPETAGFQEISVRVEVQEAQALVGPATLTAALRWEAQGSTLPTRNTCSAAC